MPVLTELFMYFLWPLFILIFIGIIIVSLQIVHLTSFWLNIVNKSLNFGANKVSFTAPLMPNSSQRWRSEFGLKYPSSDLQVFPVHSAKKHLDDCNQISYIKEIKAFIHFILHGTFILGNVLAVPLCSSCLLLYPLADCSRFRSPVARFRVWLLINEWKHSPPRQSVIVTLILSSTRGRPHPHVLSARNSGPVEIFLLLLFFIVEGNRVLSAIESSDHDKSLSSWLCFSVQERCLTFNSLTETEPFVIYAPPGTFRVEVIK